jgi:putative tryptophan/tyrosine transport system substrate-binding protein
MGGLMSYEADQTDIQYHLAETVHKVFRGTNPSDIPIYQPSKFRLYINSATAKAIGIDIPPLLLTMATEVIE